MSYELTDDQKRALRWIVEQARTREDIILSWSRMGMHTPWDVEAPPSSIAKNTFDTLEQEGYIDIHAPQKNAYVITSTEQAFEAVDLGFE